MDGRVRYAKRLHAMQDDDWHEAVLMWRDGFDTADIADHFKVTEAVIYNQLPRIALLNARAA